MIRSITQRCIVALAVFTLTLLMTGVANAQANLVFTQFTVSPTFDIDANGNLTYTATVQNTGNVDATNVVVTFTLTHDDLPISPSPSGGCLFTPGSAQLTVVCTLDRLQESGGTHDFIIVVHPTDTAPRDVNVTAQADGVSPISSFVTSNIIEVGLSEMQVTLTSTNPGKVGEALVYNVMVFNIQDDDAANVFAVLALPKKATFVSATKGCTHGTLVTCKLGSMAPGTGKTVTITVLPTVSGWTQATAGVRLTTPDRDPSNNSAATSIWVNP
ncbi:MAG: DUF11 domain-containing protein [Acidobacteriia bacterium]|nr:DUF11 domain-containing protein [Terriglobia bacterium]